MKTETLTFAGKVETRDLASPVSLAATGSEAPRKLTGYAAKYNVESSVLYDPAVCKGPFVEVIAPGAFARTLRESPDVRALYNHDTSHVLGRTASGTLFLREDEVGLAFELVLPDTQVARDLAVSVDRGDIDGCSFGFYVVEDEVEFREGQPALRTLLDVEVFEITPGTAFPAYGSTTLALRSKRTEHRAGDVARPVLNHSRDRLRLLLAGD